MLSSGLEEITRHKFSFENFCFEYPLDTIQNGHVLLDLLEFFPFLKRISFTIFPPESFYYLVNPLIFPYFLSTFLINRHPWALFLIFSPLTLLYSSSDFLSFLIFLIFHSPLTSYFFSSVTHRIWANAPSFCQSHSKPLLKKPQNPEKKNTKIIYFQIILLIVTFSVYFVNIYNNSKKSQAKPHSIRYLFTEKREKNEKKNQERSALFHLNV